ncbi:MAG: MBL fold metallo-hydrolase [Fimbriiglobus sp.]
MAPRAFSNLQLVNGSTGDPVLYIDYPGSQNALLFDAGENDNLTKAQLADLEAVFVTHHHVDHFIGLDRIIRANLDSDKTLHIYGPTKTISRVYDRVKSYDYPFFPFMKLELAVHELDGSTERIGRFGCATKFAPPVIEEKPWSGVVCYRNDHMTVEAVPVVHTVPCLAFALVERGGFHLDRTKLQSGLLKGGDWVAEVLKRIEANSNRNDKLTIQGGEFRLQALIDDYFTESTGARITYITDTFLTDELRPTLVKLAKGATRLFCDSFYAKAQAKDAAKHKHMMAYQAAELAKAAKVEELTIMHFSTRYAGKYDTLLAEASAIFPRTTSDVK